MLKPSRLSSLICSTSFPLNKGRPSSVSRFGRFITSGGGNFFNRHYGYFCTGTDRCTCSRPQLTSLDWGLGAGGWMGGKVLIRRGRKGDFFRTGENDRLRGGQGCSGNRPGIQRDASAA